MSYLQATCHEKSTPHNVNETKGSTNVASLPTPHWQQMIRLSWLGFQGTPWALLAIPVI